MHAVALDGTVDLPAGTTLEQVAHVLRELVVRHDSLRTTYPVGEEAAQVVAAQGIVHMSVHECIAEQVESLGRALREEMLAVPFEPDREFPTRIALITVAGAPVQAVVVVSHLACDAAAFDLLGQEFAARLAGRTLPPAGLRPIDLARLERTPAVDRRLRASGAHWAASLRTAPHSLLPARREPDPAADRTLLIMSASAGSAIERIARRTRLTKSSIALTAVVATLSHLTGNPRCAVTMPSANRFLPHLQSCLGTVATDGFMSVDLSRGRTFDDAARIVSDGALRAYRHGQFRTDEVWAFIDAVAVERGIDAYARECVFNDMSARNQVPAVADGPGRPDELLHWLPREANGARLLTRFTINVLRFEPELVATVWVDPTRLSGAEVLAYARGLIELLTAVAERPTDLAEALHRTEITPLCHPRGWHLVDHGWIDTEAVRDLMGEVVTNGSIAIDAVPDLLMGHRLVCHVTNAHRPISTREVHQAVVARLPGRSAVMAPHEYRVQRCDDGLRVHGGPDGGTR
jgi:hypothetical protein